MNIEANTFKKLQNIASNISWKHLIAGREYSFELLFPFSAPETYFGANKSYIIVAAQVIKAQTCNVLSLYEGQQILLNLALGAFTRAWWSVSYLLRSNMTSEHGVRITFKKDSDKAMTIKHVELMIPSPEQKKFAEFVYGPVCKEIVLANKKSQEKRLERMNEKD